MTHRFSLTVAAACLVAGVATPALAAAPAQDSPLGPMAEVMANRAGHWKVDITFRPAPGAPAATSHATQDNRLEGGWLISELHGEMGARPFTGFGINGYDSMHDKYVGVWVDSVSHAIVPVEGTYDVKTRAFITVSDQATPHGIEHIRTVTRMIDRNVEETALEATLPDGRTFTRMTMRLTRQ